MMTIECHRRVVGYLRRGRVCYAVRANIRIDNACRLRDDDDQPAFIASSADQAVRSPGSIGGLGNARRPSPASQERPRRLLVSRRKAPFNSDPVFGLMFRMRVRRGGASGPDWKICPA
jgi:hypothetical protein